MFFAIEKALPVAGVPFPEIFYKKEDYEACVNSQLLTVYIISQVAVSYPPFFGQPTFTH